MDYYEALGVETRCPMDHLPGAPPKAAAAKAEKAAAPKADSKAAPASVSPKVGGASAKVLTHIP